MSELARRKVANAIAIEYSYGEILEFSAHFRHDLARRRAIEDLFSVLSGQGHLEEMLWFYYQRRLAVTRECWEFSGRVYAKAAYANLKRDPRRYDARLQYKAEHKRKQRALAGRGYRRGESVASAKLTTADVVAIRASSETGAALARRFGVSPATISGIRSGKKWAHLPGGQTGVGDSAGNPPNTGKQA